MFDASKTCKKPRFFSTLGGPASTKICSTPIYAKMSDDHITGSNRQDRGRYFFFTTLTGNFADRQLSSDGIFFSFFFTSFLPRSDFFTRDRVQTSFLPRSDFFTRDRVVHQQTNFLPRSDFFASCLRGQDGSQLSSYTLVELTAPLIGFHTEGTSAFSNLVPIVVNSPWKSCVQTVSSFVTAP